MLFKAVPSQLKKLLRMATTVFAIFNRLLLKRIYQTRTFFLHPINQNPRI